jgi:hypothetical protein
MKLFKHLVPGDKILGEDHSILTIKERPKKGMIRGYLSVYHTYGRSESPPDAEILQPGDDLKHKT